MTQEIYTCSIAWTDLKNSIPLRDVNTALLLTGWSKESVAHKLVVNRRVYELIRDSEHTKQIVRLLGAEGCVTEAVREYTGLEFEICDGKNDSIFAVVKLNVAPDLSCYLHTRKP